MHSAGTEKRKNIFLNAGIICVALLLTVLSTFTIAGNKYFYADADEGTYYNGARLFVETNSARAASCNNDAVSKIGQFDWYGPAYHVLYGSIDKLFGVYCVTYVLFNLICLLLVILLVLKTSFIAEVKKLLLLSFGIMYVFVNYAFTLYPEAFQLLLASILAMQLFNISIKTANNQSAKTETALFITLTLIFSVFRITTVFWIFGLLAFSSNKKTFFARLFVAIVCIGLAILYITRFQAPYYAGNFEYITHHAPNKAVISILLHSFFFNLYTYITGLGFTDLLFPLILASSIYAWARYRNRFLLSGIILSLVYLFALLTSYTGVPVYITKQTACLLPLLLIGLYHTPQIKYYALGITLMLSPFTFIEAYKTINAHKLAMIDNERLRPLTHNLEQIKYMAKSNKPVTIVMLYNDFADVVPFSILMGNASVSNANNQPILYSFHYIEDSTNYSRNFIPTGKIYVDYFLTRKPLELDSITLACSNDLFYLYKNNRSEK